MIDRFAHALMPIRPIRRRRIWQAGAAMASALTMPEIVRAQPGRIRFGYWPVASVLPFFTAVERGFFEEADVVVELVKFMSPQQMVEAMLTGRIDGTVTAVATLAIGEIAQPGLLKRPWPRPKPMSTPLPRRST